MTAKEWEARFSDIPSNRLHDFVKCGKGYSAHYSFGEYGDREIIFDTDEFIQKFFDNYSSNMKRTHIVNFIFKADTLYFKDVEDVVKPLVYQRRFDELQKYMDSYIPKTRQGDDFGKRLQWFTATAYCETGYAFKCESFNNFVNELRGHGLMWSDGWLRDMKTPSERKYCYTKTDLSDLQYPKVRLVGRCGCTAGNHIDAWLVDKYDEFIKNDPFYAYNVNDERRDSSIERLEQRKEAAIRKFVEEMPIYSLAIKEAYGK